MSSRLYAEPTRKLPGAAHGLLLSVCLSVSALVWVGMVLCAGRASETGGTATTPKKIAVALYDGSGSTGRGVPRVLALLGGETNITATRVSAKDIRSGRLKQFDLVMFTGGSGSVQARALGPEGRQAVKDFVRQGGGYIGICAGSYLACSGFSWGLGLVNARTLSPLWERGSATVKIELTDRGREILPAWQGQVDCRYLQGPIIGPGGEDKLPQFEILSYFRTEVAKNGTPKGIMVNSPAIWASRFGDGRVLCFSPHPEQTEGLDAFVTRAVAWVARCPRVAANTPATAPASEALQ